ncbi:MAG: zinc ABC transporter substrate-binding protein [Gammaproteobacteria bacterium]|nr:zinc ABC transporter substrate-binding protein [Gammaproteobacteria bacterium]MDH5736645.1 zinc ABC transporter substrate-binding protein [Gammaproteobacteria bacterium]
MVTTTITAKKPASLIRVSRLCNALLLSLFYFGTYSYAHAASPRILVTLKPIHSLVSNLTRGISQPELLINGSQSPHDFQMKPSDRRKIANADIIIYVADSIESYLPEISNTFKQQQVIIELAKAPDIHLLKARTTDGHDHHDHHGNDDGHLWLSIENAKAISQHLYNVFSHQDPDHRTLYLDNKTRLLKRLDQLKLTISDKLSTISTKPYLTFHDAFQYFETEFHLTGSHFVTSNPEHISGIQGIHRLKQLIQSEQINCIYYEPPHLPGVIETLKENTSARSLPLDPVGTQFPADENLYFEVLNTISNQLHDCLK